MPNTSGASPAITADINSKADAKSLMSNYMQGSTKLMQLPSSVTANAKDDKNKEAPLNKTPSDTNSLVKNGTPRDPNPTSIADSLITNELYKSDFMGSKDVECAIDAPAFRNYLGFFISNAPFFGSLKAQPSNQKHTVNETNLESVNSDTKDLPSSQPALPSQTRPLSVCNLGMHHVTDESVVHGFINTFPTMQYYIEQMNYGPSGYYTTGKVKIRGFGGDFITLSQNKLFGFMFVFQLCKAYQLQIDNGYLHKDEKFTVLECGAGNGDLCHNIFEALTELLQVADNPLFQQFYRALHYFIVEISPALVEQQKERTAAYEKKVTIILGNAQRLEEFKQFKNGISVVFSNELLDMFAPHELKKENENIYVGMVIPAIPAEILRVWTKKEGVKNNFEHYSNLSNRYKKIFNLCIPQGYGDCILLSKNDFSALHIIYSNEENKDLFVFFKMYISSQFFPEVTAFLTRNPRFFDYLTPAGIQYATLGIANYLQSANDVLRPGGEIITIDYGDQACQINDYTLKVYRSHRVHFNPFCGPGFHDITHDINFSLLVNEGDALGFDTIYYGQQGGMFPRWLCHESVEMLPEMGKIKLIGFQACVQVKKNNIQPRCLCRLEDRFANVSSIVRYNDLFKLDKMVEAFIVMFGLNFMGWLIS